MALGFGRSAMRSYSRFDDLMREVRSGDAAAETTLFAQYVRRWIALAARRFDASLRDRADVEQIVLSACKSFFLRHQRGEFVLDDWGEPWSVLAMITLRKCAHRLRYFPDASIRPSRASTAASASRVIACEIDVRCPRLGTPPPGPCRSSGG